MLYFSHSLTFRLTYSFNFLRREKNRVRSWKVTFSINTCLLLKKKCHFKAWPPKFFKVLSDKDIEFVRAIAEGDLVALHTHQILPGNEEYVTMDFFRFDDNGKIVEHWDSIQKIPNESKCGNPMY